MTKYWQSSFSKMNDLFIALPTDYKGKHQWKMKVCHSIWCLLSCRSCEPFTLRYIACTTLCGAWSNGCVEAGVHWGGQVIY